MKQETKRLLEADAEIAIIWYYSSIYKEHLNEPVQAKNSVDDRIPQRIS